MTVYLEGQGTYYVVIRRGLVASCQKPLISCLIYDTRNYSGRLYRTEYWAKLRLMIEILHYFIYVYDILPDFLGLWYRSSGRIYMVPRAAKSP